VYVSIEVSVPVSGASDIMRDANSPECFYNRPKEGIWRQCEPVRNCVMHELFKPLSNIVASRVD
jgi:hypothetical protein